MGFYYMPMNKICLSVVFSPCFDKIDLQYIIWLYLVNLLADQEDYYLWPVPLKMLLTTPGNGEVYTVKSVTYNDVDYDTIQALVDAYNAGNISTSSPGVEQEYAGR